jgi:hypothetical protein
MVSQANAGQLNHDPVGFLVGDHALVLLRSSSGKLRLTKEFKQSPAVSGLLFPTFDVKLTG